MNVNWRFRMQNKRIRIAFSTQGRYASARASGIHNKVAIDATATMSCKPKHKFATAATIIRENTSGLDSVANGIVDGVKVNSIFVWSSNVHLRLPLEALFLFYAIANINKPAVSTQIGNRIRKSWDKAEYARDRPPYNLNPTTCLNMVTVHRLQ